MVEVGEISCAIYLISPGFSRETIHQEGAGSMGRQMDCRTKVLKFVRWSIIVNLREAELGIYEGDTNMRDSLMNVDGSQTWWIDKTEISIRTFRCSQQLWSNRNQGYTAQNWYPKQAVKKGTATAVLARVCGHQEHDLKILLDGETDS